MSKITCYDSDGYILKSFTQWDLGQTITFKGLDTLTDICVHFWNKSVDNALVVTAEAVSGGVTADVPNLLLQEGLPLYAFIYNHPSSTEAKTLGKVVINVIPRAKPNDYEYEENIEYMNWAVVTEEAKQLIAEWEASADRAEQAALSAESATTKANQATTAANNAASSANQAATAANNAAALAEGYVDSVNEAVSQSTEAIETAVTAQTTAENAQQDVNTLREVVSKFHSNIVEEAEGEFITVSDASDLELAGLKIFGRTEQGTTTGKNLCPKFTEGEYGGATFSYDSAQNLIVNGTAITQIYCESPYFTLPAGKYALSGAAASSYNGNLELLIQPTATMITIARTYTGLIGTFELTEATEMVVKLHILNGTECSGISFQPQIEIGITATEYEPYTGGIPSPNPDYPQALESIGDSGSVTVTACGKNLCKTHNPGTTHTHNGVTFTQNADGTITANGQNDGTGRSYWAFTFAGVWQYLPPGTYTMYGGDSTSSDYYLQVSLGDVNGEANGQTFFSRGAPTTFTIDNEQWAWIIISVASGVNANNVVFKPQIELGSAATEYEPYTATTATVSTPNGLPGIPVESGGNYTDANGQQWICDEVDFGKGVYVQRVDIKTVTECMWFNGTTGIAYCNVAYYPIRSKRWKTFCDRFHWDGLLYSNCIPGTFLLETAPHADWSDYMRAMFVLPAGVATTAADATSWLVEQGGINVLYPLYEENPIPLTDIDPDALTAYAAMHTNYPNTTVFNDAGAHMGLSYVADTRRYIDKKFDQLAKALVSST